MERWTIVAMLAALAGCDALPRDPEGTSARVTQGGQVTIGLVAPVSVASVRPLAAAVSRASGAQPRFVASSSEALAQRLERGEIDMAVGWFAKDSPWKTDIALGPAIARDDGRELKAAMRNGENRWIMTVERASRAVAPQGMPK